MNNMINTIDRTMYEYDVRRGKVIIKNGKIRLTRVVVKGTDHGPFKMSWYEDSEIRVRHACLTAEDFDANWLNEALEHVAKEDLEYKEIWVDVNAIVAYKCATDIAFRIN